MGVFLFQENADLQTFGRGEVMMSHMGEGRTSPQVMHFKGQRGVQQEAPVEIDVRDRSPESADVAQAVQNLLQSFSIELQPYSSTSSNKLFRQVRIQYALLVGELLDDHSEKFSSLLARAVQQTIGTPSIGEVDEPAWLIPSENELMAFAKKYRKDVYPNTLVAQRMRVRASGQNWVLK